LLPLKLSVRVQTGEHGLDRGLKELLVVHLLHIAPVDLKENVLEEGDGLEEGGREGGKGGGGGEEEEEPARPPAQEPHGEEGKLGEGGAEGDRGLKTTRQVRNERPQVAQRCLEARAL
jgi:hypothetical protein